jgi:ABC-2 type transport system ATP-binding protein
MLQAIGLTRHFDSHKALDQLDLTVQPGEVVCLLGANGAGKSTTLKLFLGLLKPTAGRALIGGVDVTADPLGTKRQLLYIPEQFALYGELTGLENLAYFAAISGVADRNPARLRECLIEADLPASAIDRRASTYSKGMRQKVGIALAISKQAGAMLLDEPTSGLDPKASAEFHTLLCRQRDRGSAILMATHDLFRAREVGTRIGLMREGRLRRCVLGQEVTANELEALYLEEMSFSADRPEPTPSA